MQNKKETREYEIMSEFEYTLSNIERTAVMDPAAVFSKITPKP